MTHTTRSIIFITAFTAIGLAALPEGWHLAGDRPAEYDTGVDPEMTREGQPVWFLKSKPEIKTTGFGTLMTKFDAQPWLGKRVRFSGFVKAEDVKTHGNPAWAGIWMRLDSPEGSIVLDNMHDRAIKGTKDWKSYSVVLDVPENTSGIFFGIMLAGSGSVWMSDAKLEAVGREVHVTARPNYPGGFR